MSPLLFVSSELAGDLIFSSVLVRDFDPSLASAEENLVNYHRKLVFQCVQDGSHRLT